MTASSADQNMLFGILALQMDFVGRDQLIKAMNDWVLDKSVPLADVLVAAGALSASDRELLQPMVDRHVELHQNDARESLASIEGVRSLRKDFDAISDSEIAATLMAIGKSSSEPHDLQATESHAVGASSSDGRRFQVLRPHAKGGLGQVFVARDVELNREVALKEIQARHASNKANWARFALEAEVTGGLEHPGIVPVYGLGHYDDGRPFYAMRFVRGDNLRTALERFHRAGEWQISAPQRSIEFRNLLGRVIDVCNAVEYAHSRGVLHRDLKPGNIMLGKYGETLVVDWGLAKTSQSSGEPDVSREPVLAPRSGDSGSAETAMGQAIGTPSYMSPEQAAGRLDLLGPRSDVYSLGATLYTVLTGELPFQGNDSGAILTRVQAAEFPRPRSLQPKIPRALEAICLKAMALRPEDRYPSAIALAGDLQAWLAGEPTTAWKEPLSVRLSRVIRRRQTLFASTAVALVVALASFGVGFAFLALKNRELKAANLRERVSKQLAEERFQLALDAIEHYYTEVSDDVLLQQVELSEVRKSLLSEALEFYQKLESSLIGSSQPESRFALAKAYADIAGLHYLLGDQELAMESINKAITVQQQLVASDPASQAYRFRLSVIYKSLGVILGMRGDRDKALASFQRSAEIARELSNQVPEDASYRSALAGVIFEQGNIYRSIGQTAAAAKTFEEAIVLQQDLVEEAPLSSSFRADLAATYMNFGNLKRKANETDVALKMYRDAQPILEKLVQEHPEVLKHRWGLARAYGNLGNVYSDIGKMRIALEFYNKAMKGQEFLATKMPSVPQYQSQLAATHMNLGVLYTQVGNPNAALQSYTEAFRRQEKLAQKYPDTTGYQRDLAATCVNLGSLQSQSDQKAALDTYSRGVSLLTPILQSSPNDVVAKHYMNQMLLGRIDVLNRNGRCDESLEDCERLVELYPDDVFPKITRAKTHAIAGNHAEATKEAVSISYADSITVPDQYLVAGVYALAYAAASRDGKLNKKEQARVAETYLRQSLELLKAIRKTGYLVHVDAVKHLKANADFDAIRELDEFKNFLVDLETEVSSKGSR